MELDRELDLLIERKLYKLSMPAMYSFTHENHADEV